MQRQSLIRSLYLNGPFDNPSIWWSWYAGTSLPLLRSILESAASVFFGISQFGNHSLKKNLLLKTIYCCAVFGTSKMYTMVRKYVWFIICVFSHTCSIAILKSFCLTLNSLWFFLFNFSRGKTHHIVHWVKGYNW